MFEDIWSYRGFILGSVKREFQLRYYNSLLGSAWMILHPLAMILVYTVIFSGLMRTKLPGVDGAYAYSIYLCSGILTWNLFSEIVSRCQNMFIENANLLKKISFPRICLPVIIVLSAGINFVIIFSLFTLFLISSGNFPGWVYLEVFPVLLIEIAFSIGLGVIIGVLNVFFRDVGQLVAITLQFWFWLTPIVYSINTLPEFFKSHLAFNPMTSLIDAYQCILVGHLSPQWGSLWFTGLLSVGLCFLAISLFRKHAGDMVDEL